MGVELIWCEKFISHGKQKTFKAYLFMLEKMACAIGRIGIGEEEI